MELPEFCDLSQRYLKAALERHGLAGLPVVRLPQPGIFNAVFAVGDHLVLRVPRQHPAFVDAAHKEAIAVPVARAAGVRTPRLEVFDDTLSVLPVPFSLYERVFGVTVESLRLNPAATGKAYRELGRDLGRLHVSVQQTGPVAELDLEALPEPDGWIGEFVEDGYLGPLEMRWLTDWLTRLRERAAGGPLEQVFRHGDTQATNIMVDPCLGYLAVLDWGACGWGDAAHDFAGVPLDAVPFMLQGYRDSRPLLDEGAFKAHILLRQLHIALFLLRRPPQPGRSWAERPLGMLLDFLRFVEQNQNQWITSIQD